MYDTSLQSQREVIIYFSNTAVLRLAAMAETEQRRRTSASRLRIDGGSDDELEGANYPIMETSSDEDTPSDDDVQTVMVFFRRMYEDPQQDVMEMLDGLAGEVLRTGKITVAGTAGGEL